MARIRHRRIPGTFLHMILTLTNRHIHAQIVDREAGRVLAAAHSTEPGLRQLLNAPLRGSGRYGSASVNAAKTVGQVLADRMQTKGISSVYWQRSGTYHGKIKAFVDAVREKGVQTYTPPHLEMPRPPKNVPGV